MDMSLSLLPAKRNDGSISYTYFMCIKNLDKPWTSLIVCSLSWIPASPTNGIIGKEIPYLLEEGLRYPASRPKSIIPPIREKFFRRFQISSGYLSGSGSWPLKILIEISVRDLMCIFDYAWCLLGRLNYINSDAEPNSGFFYAIDCKFFYEKFFKVSLFVSLIPDQDIKINFYRF